MDRFSIYRIIVVVSMLVASIPLIAQRDVIRAGIDLVVVPTSVRGSDGKFVYDLTRDDFTILEDGRLQEVRSLSVDPVPLSVAVLIDTGVGKTALTRVAKSVVSLSSAFADGDEAEVYRFDHITMKISDFTSSHEDLEKRLTIIGTLAAHRFDDATPIVVLPGRGPRWLRALLDAGIPFKDMNDVLFTSALDLETRPADRRKVILVISDGQVSDPNWSPFNKSSATVHWLDETRTRLLRDQIQMYGVAVGNALFDGPTSILKLYADATGGDVYRAATQNGMETAFARITEQARHQYVLSYVSNNEIKGLLAVNRKIEVKVNRPGLKVTHRKSYLQYPRPK